MQLRDHDAVASKRDYFTVDPRKLKVRPGYNVRDLESPEERPELDELKAQIRENGVETALRVLYAPESDDIFVLAGHRRLKVVLELIEEGHPFDSIPIIPVSTKGKNDGDYNFDLILSNSQKPLPPLQFAEVIRRQHVVYGWDVDKIALRAGKTKQQINDALKLAAVPEPVKAQVKQGDVSATLALKLAKENPELAAKLIADNKAENARIRGKDKRHKVTAKTLKRDKEKAKPKQNEAKHDEQTLAMVATSVEPLQNVSHGGGEPTGGPQDRDLDSGPVAPARTMTEQELIEGLAARGYHVIKDDGPEAIALPSALAATPMYSEQLLTEAALPATHPQPSAYFEIQEHQVSKINGVKHLIDALEPFAALAEFNDLNAKSDDDVIEVKVVDIKRAWRAYTDATGTA